MYNSRISSVLLLILFFSSLNAFANTLAKPKFESAHFNSNGIDIFFRTIGQGSPVVLIHGYALDSAMWDDSTLLSALTAKHKVILIDLRGHGQSEKPTLPSDYGVKVGLDIINLLDHLELPEAHMLGYSMGSYVTGRLLVTHPNRIISATMVSGYFPFSNDDELEYAEQTVRHMSDKASEYTGDKKKEYLALSAVAAGWKLEAVSDEQIARISVPLQVIFGSEELSGVYSSQKYRFTLPIGSSAPIIIEGADHDSSKAAIFTDELTRYVARFLSKTSSNVTTE